MLAKVVQANQRDWDIYITKVLFAYRTIIHESTQFTPYHLTFGRSLMLPVNIMLGQLPSVLVEEGEAVLLPQFVEETCQFIKKACSTVHGNPKQTHEYCKQAFDKKRTREDLQCGGSGVAVQPGS